IGPAHPVAGGQPVGNPALAPGNALPTLAPQLTYAPNKTAPLTGAGLPVSTAVNKPTTANRTPTTYNNPVPPPAYSRAPAGVKDDLVKATYVQTAPAHE